MKFTIMAEVSHPFAEPDIMPYETIKALNFEAVKSQIKGGCDLFGTVPEIIEESQEYISWRNPRERYSNYLFYIESN